MHSKYYGELDKINTEIENIGTPVYKKLIENPQSMESRDEQIILAILFSNLFLRNPKNVEKWRKVRTLATEKTIEQLEITSHYDSNASNLLIQWKRECENIKAKGGHHFAVDNNFSALPDIAQCIYKMSFLFLKHRMNSTF